MSIDYTRQDHIVTITINRPETRNSLDMAHFQDLAHAWATFRDDAGAWVAVITGVGPDFCTGADLKKFIPELNGDLPQPDGWNAAPVPGVQADHRCGQRNLRRGRL